MELDAERAHRAAHYATVVTGDIEDVRTIDRIYKLNTKFDAILLSHVLEHLRDPSRALQALVPLCSGSFIVAIPNVAHWRVRLELLKGRWEYQDEGILDRTHLRFFTFSTAIRLFHEAGLQVIKVVIPIFPPRGIRGLMESVTSPNFHAHTFVFQAVPLGKVVDPS